MRKGTAATDIFAGRQRELAELAAFLERTVAGQAQVVLVAGEAHAGKSSLVGEFVRRAKEARTDVLAVAGECNAQTGAGNPYLPDWRGQPQWPMPFTASLPSRC